MVTQKTSSQRRRQGNGQYFLLLQGPSKLWLVHMRHGVPLLTSRYHQADKQNPENNRKMAPVIYMHEISVFTFH